MAEFPLPVLQIWRSRKRVAIQIQLMNIHVSECKYYCLHLVPKFGDMCDRQNWRLHPTAKPSSSEQISHLLASRRAWCKEPFCLSSSRFIDLRNRLKMTNLRNWIIQPIPVTLHLEWPPPLWRQLSLLHSALCEGYLLYVLSVSAVSWFNDKYLSFNFIGQINVNYSQLTTRGLRP